MDKFKRVDQDRFKAKFTAALLKVASRCNLNCDYCYVYQHADQTWRNQPTFMTDETIRQFGSQLNVYVREHEIDQFSIIFHGGEPLLFTAERLAKACSIIRKEVVTCCNLDFSIQTNGVLLTEDALRILEEAHIGVSLSLDGPQYVNDLHRLDHSGNSSYRATNEALQRLVDSSSGTFQGVLAVIDPSVPPRELFKFFSSYEIPRLDFLLPDATHVGPRADEKSGNGLQAWLTNAFTLWYTDYSDLPIRFFDAILGSRLSIPSTTDVMGFGSVSLVVIETDGSYTDHDVFKITEEGMNHLQCNVGNASFESVATHPTILEHGRLLSLEGVAEECKTCPVLEACGGGSVMHRYHEYRGLDAPTVYCENMFSILSRATRLLSKDLNESNEQVQLPDNPPILSFTEEFVERCKHWRMSTERLANEIATDSDIQSRDAIPAAAILMRRESVSTLANIADQFSYAKPLRIWLNRVRIQVTDTWLSKPFEDSIRVLAPNSEACQHGMAMLDLSQQYLSAASPFLHVALGALVSDILFVESTLDEESGIFSFSNDSAPNVLYIAPYAGDQPLGPDDIADSILHEFLHHVLYHIELSTPLLYDHDYPRFPAPWRSGLRPAGGFLHGTFVFSGLAKFWRAIANSENLNLPGYDKYKANQNADKFLQQATYGLKSSYHFALLTPAGKRFVEQIARQLNIPSLDMNAPGILDKSVVPVSAIA